MRGSSLLFTAGIVAAAVGCRSSNSGTTADSPGGDGGGSGFYTINPRSAADMVVGGSCP